ncbi:S41 family peptidase [Aquirufa sp.]|jgi:carboxyl-terminal processing protease|uniref:S41 family peptidase n=1 Tax=Aquirufa sp. TaxID=2676249 RepID=UPI0037831C5D
MKQLLKISLLVFLGLGLWAFSRADQLFDLAKNLDIYASVIKELNQFYVDPIDPNKVVQNSIDGMLDQLDPYTVYYPEEDLDEFTTLTTGKYEGIGIRASWVDKGYFVTYVDESSPALQAGLQTGDQLISINGTQITEDSDPSMLIKGPKDSKLVAQIKRGEAQLTLTINRSTVQIKNVGYAGIIRPGIGYIQLEEFNQSATKEMKAALVQLKKEGMKKLILDLRNNPGGLLTQAIDICNFFLAKETPIVSTKGKLQEWNANYKALNSSWDTSLPIVVLINQNSASAAEIVAGVLQDYDRATIVGQRSFGKGLVQVTRDLPYRAKIKITTAKYYIPSGRCIQAIDYSENKDTTKREFKTRNGRKVNAGGGIEPDVLVGRPQANSLIQQLIKEKIFFQYARLYKLQHTTIVPAARFSVTDKEFEDFVQWVKASPFKYESPLEKQMRELLKETQKDPLYANLTATLEKIKPEWDSSVAKEMNANKKVISALLEQEIVHHYYLKKGINEWSFENDPSLLKGVELITALK